MSEKFRSHTKKTTSKQTVAFLTNKWTFIGLLVLLLGIILPASFYLIATVNQETIAKQQAAAKSQLISQAKQSYFQKESAIQVTDEKSYAVDLRDTAIPSNIKEEITSQFQTITKKWNKNSDNFWLSYIHVQSYAPNASKVQAGITHYQWNIRKKAFVQQQQKKIKTIYIQAQTGAPITSQLLLQNNEQNLAVIRTLAQQALLDQASNPKAILDDVLAIPAFTWQTPITYSPKELTVTVAKQGALEETTVHLPYTTQLATALDLSYLDPSLAQSLTPKNEENQKQIALTFDDGPDPNTTPAILDTLKDNNVHATFFQLGSNSERYPTLVKRVADEGHEIGSHTYHHYKLPSYPLATIQKELTDTDKAIYLAIGKLPTLVRPPYGAVNATVAQTAGRPIIQWDVDSRDWASKDAEKTLTQIQQTIIDNGIILMHDIQPSTVTALPKIIHWLKQQGYQLVTINQLLQSQEKAYHEYFSATDERAIS